MIMDDGARLFGSERGAAVEKLEDKEGELLLEDEGFDVVATKQLEKKEETTLLLLNLSIMFISYFLLSALSPFFPDVAEVRINSSFRLGVYNPHVSSSQYLYLYL